MSEYEEYEEVRELSPIYRGKYDISLTIPDSDGNNQHCQFKSIQPWHLLTKPKLAFELIFRNKEFYDVPIGPFSQIIPKILRIINDKCEPGKEPIFIYRRNENGVNRYFAARRF